MTDYLSQKIKNLSLLSIVMVVFIHAYNLRDRYLLPNTIVSDPLSVTSFIEYFVSNGIARFAVPIFFLISGFLFFSKFTLTLDNYLVQVGKRVKSLALPYLLWSAIGLTTVYFFQQTEVGRFAVDSWDNFNGHMTFPLCIYRWLLAPVPFQLWFVRDLFVYSLLSPLVFLLLRYLRWFPLLPLGVLWFMHIGLVFIETEGLLFFMIGGFFAIHKIPVPQNAPSIVPLLALPIWLSLLFWKTSLAFHGSPYLIPLQKIGILLGVVVIWTGYDALMQNFEDTSDDFPLTALTTFVYFAHEPLLNFITNYALYQSANPLIIYFASPIATISICIVIGLLFRTNVPPLYRFLTGGRGA